MLRLFQPRSRVVQPCAQVLCLGGQLFRAALPLFGSGALAFHICVRPLELGSQLLELGARRRGVGFRSGRRLLPSGHGFRRVLVPALPCVGLGAKPNAASLLDRCRFRDRIFERANCGQT